MIVVTGATGQLGRLVVERLLDSVPPQEIVAAVRNPAKAGDLAARGVQVRVADYVRPDTLDAAFVGAEQLLLISSSENGQRVAQHRAVIDAAARAGVGLVAYTSILHADTTPLRMAEEHVATERALAASGLPHVLLRNGWYTEMRTMAVPMALRHGAIVGCAGGGRFATAARADYAAAAAAVLTRPDQAGRVYELAGDSSYTLADLAAEIGRQAGQPVVYHDLPPAEYEAVLVGAGLSAPLAGLLADSDVGAARGGLDDDGHAMSRLIGRPTTPMRDTVAAALAALPRS